ncbi:MAG: aldo/keto reductase [SAR86 cluster bacterium]|nr:aldo/keto reductase [SAR86 cluster bacterium]PDH51287.1 MAG: aldo/keto reductase [alpha proteobacterium MED-G09]|tara:strand:+ start:13134 stop:14177 length:1044 start_codon:yes stop_codon:yes gene_type:complete
MKKRKLGKTDLEVSEICLGTMTWGEQNTESEGHAQMDYALDNGINFFDTAEMYAVPPKKETQGSTEKIIGSWFKERKSRDKVILATKVSGRSPLNWLRDDEKPTEQSRDQIFEAVDKSLLRLGTDYIDLYQLHWPDRPMNLFGGSINYEHMDEPSIDISIILDSLNELVKSGKIRYIGLSNETPWGTMKFLYHSDISSTPRVQSIQNAYNLLNRTFEIGGSEIAHREDVGLLAYSPIAQGYLSGKYQNGALPKGSRKELFNRLQRYEGPYAEEAIEAYLNIAKKYEIDPSQLANQFVTTRPFVTSNIIGATNMEQLKLAVTSIDIKLTKEIEEDIEKAYQRHGNVAS